MMMKNVRATHRHPAGRLLAALLSTVAIALPAGCEQDYYDKGDSEYSYARADFVEAYAGSDKTVLRVVTDDDADLRLTQPYTAKWIERADTVYRAVLFYNLRDGQAEPLTMSRISTLTVRSDSAARSRRHTDPLGLETAWVSTSRKYLNLGLVLMMGETTDADQAHAVGCVLDTLTLNADSTTTASLQLTHDQGGVPEYYSQQVYLSIPLRGIEADSLRFSVNTYGGVVTKSFRLTPLPQRR